MTNAAAAAAIDVVERFYNARGDRAVIDEVMSQDAVWDITPGFLNGGVYEGTDAVLEFLGGNAAEFASMAGVPERFFADEDGDVTVLGHYAVTAKDGREDEVRFHHLWTLAEGKIVRLDQAADSLVLEQLRQHCSQ